MAVEELERSIASLAHLIWHRRIRTCPRKKLLMARSLSEKLTAPCIVEYKILAVRKDFAHSTNPLLNLNQTTTCSFFNSPSRSSSKARTLQGSISFSPAKPEAICWSQVY